MFVYLDNAATTRMDEDVLRVMALFYRQNFGNAGSLHHVGQAAAEALQAARETVADAIGAEYADEIYFTSGGTEADNWALRGVRCGHIITTSIEHHAVLHTLAALEKQGICVTCLPVDRWGVVQPQQVQAAIRPDTGLISVMFANNEIGTIEPIKQIGAIARSRGILFHTDAVQAVGHVPIDVRDMQIDLLSLSAHKCNAPKGVGALYMRRGIRLPGLMTGGRQEFGLRPGTENVPGIVALSHALQQAMDKMQERTEAVCRLRDRLRAGLAGIPGCRLHTPAENCLPGIVNFSIEGLQGESLLLLLDTLGICASSGAACTSGSLDPSHVLLACGLDEAQARDAVRFSLDYHNTDKEVDYVLESLAGIVKKLRSLA